MSVTVINQTIRAMCLEVKAQDEQLQNWQQMTEADLLYEVAICIFGSQLVFEMAVAIADRLREARLIHTSLLGVDAKTFESRITTALSEPVQIVSGDGSVKWVKPRFKKIGWHHC